MKWLIFILCLLSILSSIPICFANADEDLSVFDGWLKEADRQFDDIRFGNAETLGSPLPQEAWNYNSKLVFVLYNIMDDQRENSLESARSGSDFYGIPNSWLAKELSEAEKVLLLQQVSVSSTSREGHDYTVYAKLVLVNPRTGAVLEYSFSPSVHLTEKEKEAFDIMGVVSCREFLADYADKISNTGGSEDRYAEAMAFYKDEKYYSAWQAFLDSEYGDWEDMAAKCKQQQPATGEIWHDPSIWVKDMDLTFRIDQPESSSIFLRLYRDGNPVSYVFVSGAGETTVQLPGNGYYTIKDGMGSVWYGTKEAFGPDGSYETMTFNESGSEKVYLQSYYQYTIFINVAGGGTGIGSKDETWDTFAE